MERTLLSVAFDVDVDLDLDLYSRLSGAGAPSLSLRSLERQGGDFDFLTFCPVRRITVEERKSGASAPRKGVKIDAGFSPRGTVAEIGDERAERTTTLQSRSDGIH